MPRLLRTFDALSVALLASISTATLAQTSAPSGAPPMQQRLADFVQRRLDHLAQRLEIRADQQDAWQAYVRTVQGSLATVATMAPTRPALDADAATWARYRADRAAERARHLAQEADATAALQRSLSAQQAQVLSQAVRGSDHGRGRRQSGRY